MSPSIWVKKNEVEILDEFPPAGKFAEIKSILSDHCQTKWVHLLGNRIFQNVNKTQTADD